MTVIRSAVFNLWFFGITFVLGLWGVVLRLAAPHRALGLAQLWARWVLAGARAICGIRIVVLGREHLPVTGPALIASQHQSAFDTLVWLGLVPRAAYVFKAELGRIPLFGPLLHAAGQIAVDRAAGTAAVRSLLRGVDRAVADGRQIVIFPEGTRVAPGERVALQPGVATLAARTRLPVIPVATDSGLRWRRRAFAKYPGPIHVVICPPIPPGLRGDALLAEIQARWQTAWIGLRGGADAPVVEAAPGAPAR